jgi:hypothetical protein
VIPRTLESTVRRALRTFPVALVTGPRQSGKTTLLRERWGASHRFVSLEDPDVRERALSDPRAFLRWAPPPVFLDEIQYAPSLLPYVKTLVDEDRRPGRWLLSGSQSFGLMQGVTESLAGRIAVLALLPLSLAEATGRPGGEKPIGRILKELFRPGRPRASRRRTRIELADWLLRGGYPEIRANPRVDRRIWCAGYVQTYLERDVRQVVRIGDLRTFQTFLRMAAARTGQILSYADLARDVGVSPTTIRSWLSVLEASYQILLLPPHHANLGKRLVKSPKIYFLDTGLASYLCGLHDPEALLHGPMAGALFETAVIAEWAKAFLHRGETPPLYFWRSSDGLEVDLLVERDGRLYPMEAKLASTVRPQHGDSLRRWIERARHRVPIGLVVADGPDRAPLAPGIETVSWSGLV